MKLPAYPKYKPSGVEWLGDVPAEWDRCRFSREVMIAEGQVDPEKPPFASMILIGPEHVESRTGRLLETSSAAEQMAESGKYFCHKGNVVYSKIRPALCKVTLAPEDCLCSADMYPLQPGRRFRSKYLFWLLLSEGFSAWSVLEADRVAMPKINRDTLNSLQMPVPSLEEQDAIANFLALETGRMDSLLAKKRTLVARLKEKRTALISRTVTRGLPADAARIAGLDPHPKLKPSGIDWLGEVPTHWSTSRIKYLAQIESGHTPSRSVEEYWVDCSIPWVSLNDSAYLREHDYISDTAYQISELGMANSSAHLLPAGAVVFSRDATVGLCAITTRPMAVSQHFIAYLCGPRLVPTYLLLALKAMSQHLERLSMGATIPTIGMPDVRSLACPVPPLPEQKAIVDFVTLETARLDELIEKVDSVIDRLREYRTALITAAVTGKIDVRGVQS